MRLKSIGVLRGYAMGKTQLSRIADNIEREVEKALEFERSENTKLRTVLGGGSIVTDYWKDEDGTMHVLTTDGEHTYEYMRGGLADENAKLRELVRNLWPFVKAGWVSACPNRECCLFEKCDADSEYECLIEEHMAGRMRELGIEVDG